MKKVDTRIQFTKKRLREAVLELLRDTPIDKVTVKDICEKAELNRGTFYLHYNCPAALLREIEDEFLEEAARRLQSVLIVAQNKEASVVEALFTFLKTNSDVVCVLLGPHGDPNFISEILKGMRGGVLDQWQLEFPHYRREDLDFVFDYVLIGSTRLILNWLQDSRGVPASQFSKRVERLGHHALMSITEF